MTQMSFLMAFLTVRCTSLASLTCFSPRNNKGWWLTTRLHPLAMASSMTCSVTSRHNNAPETSVSVNPICRPALSQLSCSGRGANCSRAFSTCCIFTLVLLNAGAKLLIFLGTSVTVVQFLPKINNSCCFSHKKVQNLAILQSCILATCVSLKREEISNYYIIYILYNN